MNATPDWLPFAAFTGLGLLWSVFALGGSLIGRHTRTQATEDSGDRPGGLVVSRPGGQGRRSSSTR